MFCLLKKKKKKKATLPFSHLGNSIYSMQINGTQINDVLKITCVIRLTDELLTRYIFPKW